MTLPVRRWYGVVIAAGLVVNAFDASAQTIGSLRWQQQPHCNVITLNVVQAGPIFELDGFDDQCGASTRAAVSGLAFLNPNGTVGMGLTIVTTPGGVPTHVDATILVATVSGTWRDASGATGDWTLRSGPSSGGPPRPPVRPVFAQGISAGGATVANVAAPTGATDAANKAYVDSGDAAVLALVSAGDAAARAFALTLVTTSVPVTGYSAVVLSGSASPKPAGCMEAALSVGAVLRVDLPVPIGAVIQGLRVRYQNNTQILGGLTFRIQRLLFASGGIGEDVVHEFASDGGGFELQQITVNLPPVTSSRTFHLDITVPPTSATGIPSGFCGAEVLFTRP